MSQFPLTYRPEQHDVFLDAVADWLRSEAIGWLLDEVPTFPDAERREQPVVLGRPERLRDPSASFSDLVAALGGLDDWRTHGTAWDTRHREERQAVHLAFDSGRLDEIDVRNRARDLGMRSSRKAGEGEHRVVVALGGARMAPLNRTEWAVEQLASGRIETQDLVALGSNRPLHAELELPLEELREYAGGDARTEVDLLDGALRTTLALPQEWISAEEAVGVRRDHKTHWSWRRADDVALGADGAALNVHLVEAPTTQIQRTRVDTAESLEFLTNGRAGLAHRELDVPEPDRPGIAGRGLRVGAGHSVVLSTSAIYTPYTQLVGVRVLGLQGCIVETVAHPLDYGRLPVPAFQTGAQYVQEVRSAFQAAFDLADALAD